MMNLGLSLTTGLQMELRQKLSPQIIQSIEILQLSQLELESAIIKELEENPCIEEGPPEPAPHESDNGSPTTGDAADAADAARETEPTLDATPDYDRIESFSREFPDVYEIDGARRRGTMEASDRAYEALQNTEVQTRGLAEAVYEHYCLVEDDPFKRKLAEHIIYNLDARGYLTISTQDLVDSFDEVAAIEQFEEVLARIQRLDPPGIGARSLVECLLLQLNPDDPDVHLKKRLIELHLDDVRRNKLPKVAHDLGLELDRLKDLLEALHGLDPHPGSRFIVEASHYVRPDVIVGERDGEYVVETTHVSLPSFHISERYLLLLNPPPNPTPQQKAFLDGFSDEDKVFIRRKLENARSLREAIARRSWTIERVARTIIERQTEFLEHGVTHLKPMKMQEIADELGVHVSTVSRALSNKYVQTSRGIFPFKYFFTTGITSDDGDAESTEAVREHIRALLDEEDKRSPLSDDEIARKLRGRFGLAVARRTVTKYRKVMKIPSSHGRREY